MVRNIFKGLGIALVTPFNEDGTVDYDSLKRLVEYQLKNGADFFCILATTGETPCLSTEEKLKIKNLVNNMTLQEKIDKLPLSIESDGKKYKLFISIIPEIIDLVYWSPNMEDKISIQNKETDLSISQRLEDVVGRALTIIENKEWENEIL